ncbi:DsbA family protein [Streptomyces sp. I05A-00742]|uniref:DsbA family protein n=1 Tax=Streptomyces sp. I05A-00742 TaxID=2732853 RepID=UPI001487A50E|nr:DsbA family protein [Streptomyces sp. I05A-00742]
MARQRRLTVTYAFDAYCGWCYGFGPTVREFAAVNADRLDLRVVSGGLFTGARAQPVGAYASYIPQSDARIAELTGAVFGEAYSRAVAEGTTVLDSADAATALVALARQVPGDAPGGPGGRTLELAGALQRAWYRDGRSLSDPATLKAVAEGAGLDGDDAVAAYALPGTRQEALAGFREVRRLGVDSFPTLLLHTADGGVRRLGGPATSAQALTRALDEHGTGA